MAGGRGATRERLGRNCTSFDLESEHSWHGADEDTGQQTQILFYSTKGEYGCFSNFAAYPFAGHGRTWPAAEH